MKPVTSTSSICIEKVSRFQKPSPHMRITASGVWRSTAMAATAAMMVSSSTKI